MDGNRLGWPRALVIISSIAGMVVLGVFAPATATAALAAIGGIGGGAGVQLVAGRKKKDSDAG